MPQCNRCEDKTEYEWFENFQGKWKLGIKLDINNYRPHKCIPKNDIQQGNKRNWIKFICEKCKRETRRNVKLDNKDLNLCVECREY